MKGKPAIADKGSDALQIAPEVSQENGDGGLDLLKSIEEAITDFILELIEELFPRD